MERYNLIVIGGGAGGLTVAAVAALLGARVALLEKDRLGETASMTAASPRRPC
jgi:pyruvate/2-oxoglutarate dehydrogenase complex dihydrolipoamide dehydrogenase (E3) component